MELINNTPILEFKFQLAKDILPGSVFYLKDDNTREDSIYIRVARKTESYKINHIFAVGLKSGLFYYIPELTTVIPVSGKFEYTLEQVNTIDKLLEDDFK